MSGIGTQSHHVLLLTDMQSEGLEPSPAISSKDAVSRIGAQTSSLCFAAGRDAVEDWGPVLPQLFAFGRDAVQGLEPILVMFCF